MLTGIVGPLGAGKTLFMTKCLYDEFKKNNMHVYANYKLNFPYCELNINDLMKKDSSLKNIAIGIDEFHIFFDSRVSASSRNRFTSYFILQTRKRNVNFYFTTQHIGQVDKRLRQQMHRLIVCNRTGIDRDKDGKEDTFRLSIIDLTTTPNRIKYINFYGKKYFELYDTGEIIEPIYE